MKKISLIIMMSLIGGINLLYADCEEAKSEGENLIVTVEPATLKDEDTILQVIMISDKIYLEISEDNTGSTNKYYKSDLGDSVFLTIKSPDIYSNVKYEIKTYYSDETCGVEPIKTYTVETGIYNKFSDSEVCWDKLDLDVCKNNYTADEVKKYYNDKELSEDNIEKIIKEEKTQKDAENKKSVIDIIKEYYLYVLVPIMVLSVFYVTRILIIKKRKEVQNEK